MSRLASRLRIGEKIALGFGLVMAIFLGVIGHDQIALGRLSSDYDRLYAVYGARQSYAFGIERRLSAMRAAQADFLITRSLDAAAEVTRQAAALDEEARALGLIDAESSQAAGQIQALSTDYLQRFELIVDAWRIKGLDEDSGLQGDFRRSAHELEALAGAAQWGPGLATEVLQLRRREKDYLLRGADVYVVMVDEILGRIGARIEGQATVPVAIQADVQAEVQTGQAPPGESERRALSQRLLSYKRDFHALIEQDRRIAGLSLAMGEAAARITPLVQQNLEDANRLMASMTRKMADQAAAQGRRNLIIVLAATLLGVIFAFLFTARIVRSVRTIASLLDRLTTETPRERIPITAHARDEIDAMARSLNTLADHKATFVSWWRAAMREAVAMRDVHAAAGTPDCARAADELRRAVAARMEQIRAVRQQIHAHARRIEVVVERLAGSRSAPAASDLATLREASSGLVLLLAALEAESGQPADLPLIDTTQSGN